MSSVSLEKNGVPRLFYWLLQQRFTGIVHLRSLQGKADAKVWIREGLPWFSDLQSQNALLGELLLRKGMIRQDQLHQALMEMAKTGALLGHLLVGQGVLNAESLGQVLALQCCEKLCELFAVNAGQAQLEQNAKLPGLQGGLSQGVNSLRLIALGIRRHWTQDRIRSAWPEGLNQSIRTGLAFRRYRAHFGFNQEELASARSLEQGWMLGQADPQGICERIAFTLWNCGMVELKPVSKKGPTSVPRRRKTVAPEKNPTPQSPRTNPLPIARSDRPKTEAPVRANEQPKQVNPPRRNKGSSAKKNDQTSCALRTPEGKALFVKKLEALEELISSQANAFSLFDLPLTASRADVRRRWNLLSREFHPDALAHRELGTLHSRSQSVFAHLSNAYQILSSKERRNALKAQIESGIAPGQDAESFVRQSLEAESLAKDAERLLKKHQYAKAYELLERSNELRKDQAEVLAGIAWCGFHIGGRSKSAAREAIQTLKSIALKHEKCASALYYLGLVHNANAEHGPARQAFSQALALNPRLVDAERQLRALTQITSAANDKPKRKKLFGR